MKRLATQLGRDTAEIRVSDRFPVERIAEDRMPVLGEMHSNLMSSPSLETATNKGASVQKLDGF